MAQGVLIKKWFENYLFNKTQIAKYGKIQHEEMTIGSGFPQGSALGPILFILYINDIQSCSPLISNEYLTSLSMIRFFLPSTSNICKLFFI